MLDEAETGGGDCYEAHANFLADLRIRGDTEELSKWTLVHGIPLGQGPIAGLRFIHCWLETDGQLSSQGDHTIPGSGQTVVDLSNGRNIRMPRMIYYSVGNIDPDECVYYTPDEAMERMIEEGIYGPWDIDPPM
jgi:hypothetical protein